MQALIWQFKFIELFFDAKLYKTVLKHGAELELTLINFSSFLVSN